MSGSSVSNVAPYPRRRSRESTDVHQGHPVCSDTHLKQQVGALAEQVTGGQTPIMWSTGAGADMMKRIAAPMVGGLATSFLLELLVYPVLFAIWKWRFEMRRGAMSPQAMVA